VIAWSPPSAITRAPELARAPITRSIAASAPSPSGISTSPASLKRASHPRSSPDSVERFEEGERIAARIKGGAPAAPRWKDECSSQGKPRSATRAISKA
jgi:hypothetical protein